MTTLMAFMDENKRAWAVDTGSRERELSPGGRVEICEQKKSNIHYIFQQKKLESVKPQAQYQVL